MSVRLAALDALMERICLVAGNTNKLVGSIPKDLHELVYQNQAVAMRFIVAEVDRLNAEHPSAWSKELFDARAAEIRQQHQEDAVLRVPDKHEDVLATSATPRMTLTVNEIADIIGAIDFGEQTEKLIYARLGKAFNQAAATHGRAATPTPTYVMQPGQIPPGFILIDENQLRAELLGPSPAVTEHVRDVIAERISVMFKKVG